MWDFAAAQQQQQHRQAAAGAAPIFALEPPALVEYSNSTGAVIACRPTLASTSGAAAAADAAGWPDSPQPQPPSGDKRRPPVAISWLVADGGVALEVPEDGEGAGRGASGWRELEAARRGAGAARFVRQDGALVIAPAANRGAGSHEGENPISGSSSGSNEEDLDANCGQIYRCCLANQFGSLCSRPVRTRTGE